MQQESHIEMLLVSLGWSAQWRSLLRSDALANHGRSLCPMLWRGEGPSRLVKEQSSEANMWSCVTFHPRGYLLIFDSKMNFDIQVLELHMPLLAARSQATLCILQQHGILLFNAFNAFNALLKIIPEVSNYCCFLFHPSYSFYTGRDLVREAKQVKISCSGDFLSNCVYQILNWFKTLTSQRGCLGPWTFQYLKFNSPNKNIKKVGDFLFLFLKTAVFYKNGQKQQFKYLN